MGPEGSFSLTDKGIFRIWRKNVTAGEKFTLCVFAGIYTGLDTDDPARDAQALCVSAKAQGYEACLQAHRNAWEKVWQQSEVVLEGDEKASLALHASQYHLNCIAPRHAGNMSIPARGLSGQTYKGAIFWESEIFFFPMFVYTQPEAARSL
ncbi:MAG: glycoside hydrolase family 65 protein, partial [Clostridia bacterium]|nr:glycoside hydrolase family 65 protein [Clostridia bacterium]